MGSLKGDRSATFNSPPRVGLLSIKRTCAPRSAAAVAAVKPAGPPPGNRGPSAPPRPRPTETIGTVEAPDTDHRNGNRLLQRPADSQQAAPRDIRRRRHP